MSDEEYQKVQKAIALYEEGHAKSQEIIGLQTKRIAELEGALRFIMPKKPPPIWPNAWWEVARFQIGDVRRVWALIEGKDSAG